MTNIKHFFTVGGGYSFLMGVEKTFFRVVSILGPVAFELLPETWMNITLGAAITFFVNYAKNHDNEEGQD